MTPELESAVSQPHAMVFFAVEVLAPTFTIRLLDGASEVEFEPGRVFKGSDDTFGTLGSLQAITEGLGTEAPRMRLEIRPPTRAAAATLNLPENQGSPVRLYFGAVNSVTGAVVPSPDLIFFGKLDVPKYAGGRARRIEFDVFSAWEDLFSDAEGERLNHAFHTKAFPNERGLEFVSDVERQLPWGADVPKSPAVSSATGVGGGGAGGGGYGGGIGGSGGSGGFSQQDLINIARYLA